MYNNNNDHKKTDKVISSIKGGIIKLKVRFADLFRMIAGDFKTGKASKDEMIAVVVSVFTVLFLLIALIIPDKGFSDRENRVLTQFPHLTAASVTDGSYMTDMESYVADQFPFRNAWISMRTGLRSLTGRSDSNGVFRGSNGYLFENIPTPDEKRMEENAQSINNFASSTGLPVYLLIAPNAANILSDYLPENAPVRDQNVDIDNFVAQLSDAVRFIDVRDEMKSADPGTQLFYRTDHHWTTDGAFIAFNYAAQIMGVDTSGTSYQYYAIANDFSGTLAAKSGFSVKKDTIKTFLDDRNIDYVVEYTQEAKKTTTVYDMDKLSTSDKYAVFFGGNHSEVVIKTTSTSGRRALVVKDSYANSFVPFMIPYFTEIVMVDPRYYYDNIYDLIKTEGITEALFLYNGNTFFEDDSMSGVLQQ